MTSPAQLAASLGHEPTAPEWRTTSEPPIPMEKFGKDHWSTFAYVETREVDYKGTIGHDHMRCHGARHPILLHFKKSRLTGGDASRYPTRLRSEMPLGQVTGDPQPVVQPDHDDYDCLDDLIAAGLLEVRMPRLSRTGRSFLDANGKIVRDLDRQIIDPGFVTGLAELELCAYATWHLTENGREVAKQLRAHKANGGNFATFVPEV